MVFKSQNNFCFFLFLFFTICHFQSTGQSWVSEIKSALVDDEYYLFELENEQYMVVGKSSIVVLNSNGQKTSQKNISFPGNNIKKVMVVDSIIISISRDFPSSYVLSHHNLFGELIFIKEIVEASVFLDAVLVNGNDFIVSIVADDLSKACLIKFDLEGNELKRVESFPGLFPSNLIRVTDDLLVGSGTSNLLNYFELDADLNITLNKTFEDRFIGSIFRYNSNIFFNSFDTTNFDHYISRLNNAKEIEDEIKIAECNTQCLTLFSGVIENEIVVFRKENVINTDLSLFCGPLDLTQFSHLPISNINNPVDDVYPFAKAIKIDDGILLGHSTFENGQFVPVIYKISDLCESDISETISSIHAFNSDNINDFHLFPNPSSSSIQINSTSNIENVTVYNYLGTMIESFPFTSSSNFKVSLKVNNPPGIYNIVVNNNYQSSKKLIIAH